ncbi:MAG: NAD-dependent epimerase/dehydratase family protein [Nitrosopumilus sp.]
MVKDNQIVITGASGFIARNLRKYLSEKNIKLISISRNDFKQFKNEHKVISKNYNEKNILSKIKNSDALIHLVGIGKQSIKTDYDMINIEFTNNIVNLCKKAKIKKFIYTSGLGVSHNTSLGYFISKYKAERQIINSGLNYTIFRPSYIVGRDDLFTKYLKKQIKKGKIEIPGSGTYSFQPIYINDVVKIILQSVLQAKFRNKIIDLVGPDCITFEQYVKLFSKGTKTIIRKINLEDVYYSAITNSNSDFGVDDLNILIGNFKGNHNKLRKITEMKFQSVLELLKSGRLL